MCNQDKLAEPGTNYVQQNTADITQGENIFTCTQKQNNFICRPQKQK